MKKLEFGLGSHYRHIRAITLRKAIEHSLYGGALTLYMPVPTMDCELDVPRHKRVRAGHNLFSVHRFLRPPEWRRGFGRGE